MPAVCLYGNTSAFSHRHTPIQCYDPIPIAAARNLWCRPCSVIRAAQRQHLQQQQQHLLHKTASPKQQAPSRQRHHEVASASEGAAADVSGDAGERISAQTLHHQQHMPHVTKVNFCHSSSRKLHCSVASCDVSGSRFGHHMLLCPFHADGSSWFTRVVLPLALVLLVCNMDRICLSVAILPMAQEFGWPATVQVMVSRHGMHHPSSAAAAATASRTPALPTLQ